MMAPVLFNPYQQLIIHTSVQVLRQWFWTLPLAYSIGDFIQEVKKWYHEGYLDEGVWDHLRTVVNPEVVPTDVIRKQTHALSPSSSTTVALVSDCTFSIPSDEG